jgi:hypothetical protein
MFLNKSTKRLMGFTMPLDSTRGAPVITVRFGEWRKVGALTLFHRIEIAGGRSRVGLEVTSVTFDAVDANDPRFTSPVLSKDTASHG